LLLSVSKFNKCRFFILLEMVKLVELRRIIGDASEVCYDDYRISQYLISFDRKSITPIYHKLSEIYEILWDAWAIIAGMIDKDWRCLCLGISVSWTEEGERE